MNIRCTKEKPLCEPDWRKPNCDKPFPLYNDTYVCGRPPGHEGPHIACECEEEVVPYEDVEHNIMIWDDEGNILYNRLGES